MEAGKQFLTRRQNLEAALVSAELNLHNAVNKLARNGGDINGASEILDRARVRCRQAHAALVKFKATEQ